MNKDYNSFFWLHIKKSAGISTRKLLQPYYNDTDRIKKPKCFILSKPEEYNDVLNNYRVVLGDYQFKRALFAKKYLYPNNWDNIFSFAFSREPIDRCISMFFYLYYDPIAPSSVSYEFDRFLDLVEITHFQSDTTYGPKGLHFSTHTAPMYGDITDHNGNILLTKVYRLENLIEGINEAYSKCGINQRISDTLFKNKNFKRQYFLPNNSQIKKIELIYGQDFELYESTRPM